MNEDDTFKALCKPNIIEMENIFLQWHELQYLVSFEEKKEFLNRYYWDIEEFQGELIKRLK